MKRITALLTVLLATSLLTGCESSKTPLSGKRETLFSTDRTLKAESTYNTAPVSIKAETNKEWTIPGGSLNHFLPPLSVPAIPKEMWTTNIGYGASSEKRFVSTLIASPTLIFGMDTHGEVVALKKKNGDKIWSVSTSHEGRDSDTLGGGIAYANDRVFVTTSFGDVIALDAKAGKEIWRQPLLTPMRIAPVVHQDRVFAVTISNELHALDAKTGKSLWTHAGLPENTGLLGGGVPAIENNVIIVPYSSGELYALHVENGYPLWTDTLTPTLSADSLSSISHIRARPVIYQGVLYAVSHGGRMAATDANTGIRLWQKEISSIRTPAIIDNYIYLISINSELVCLNRQNGEIVWTVALPMTSNNKKINWAGPLATSQGLLITGSNGEIAFYSAKDGKKGHTIETGQTFSLSPIIVDKKIYTLDDSANVTAWH